MGCSSPINTMITINGLEEIVQLKLLLNQQENGGLTTAGVYYEAVISLRLKSDQFVAPFNMIIRCGTVVELYCNMCTCIKCMHKIKALNYNIVAVCSFITNELCNFSRIKRL